MGLNLFDDRLILNGNGHLERRFFLGKCNLAVAGLTLAGLHRAGPQNGRLLIFNLGNALAGFTQLFDTLSSLSGDRLFLVLLLLGLFFFLLLQVHDQLKSATNAIGNVVIHRCISRGNPHSDLLKFGDHHRILHLELCS